MRNLNSVENDVKILLVDDVIENLIALEALLRKEDAELFSCASANQALELLLLHDFALAILDVKMPDMSGFELAELMRSTEKTKRIPIIFVTASSVEKSFSFKGYESGAVDFLFKPLDNYTVKSKVGVFIELYRQHNNLKNYLLELEQAREEQNKLVQQLQSTQQELQQSIRIRDDFMSIVSHELRTPLNTLKLELYTRKQCLMSGDESSFSLDKIAQMIEIDERQLERIIRLINDMLDVSRIRTGQLSLRPTRVELTAMVKRALEQFDAQLNQAGCEVHLHMSEPFYANADEFRIEQAFINLLTNAMRYGRGKPIDIYVQSLENLARISVRDNGCGIKCEDQQRIFQPFERATSVHRKDSLGLGLYIANQIITAHGGSLEVVSAPDQGSTFIMSFPQT